MGGSFSSEWSGTDDTCVRCEKTGKYGVADDGTLPAHGPMTKMTALQYSSGTGNVQGSCIPCRFCKQKQSGSAKVYACKGKGCEVHFDGSSMCCKKCGPRVQQTQAWRGEVESLNPALKNCFNSVICSALKDGKKSCPSAENCTLACYKTIMLARYQPTHADFAKLFP
jgi:hypothetical protein